MFVERNPWIVVVGSVLVAAGAYFSVVLVNGVDKSDLLGSWFFYAVVFISFAAIALAIYRSLGRSRDPQALDEARPKHGH